MKKKVLALILALAMAVTIGAPGRMDGSGSAKAAEGSETTPSTEAAASAETAISDETKVSLTFSELSEEDQETILAMIYRKEGLDGIMMLDEPVSQADEKIDKKWFAIVKDGQPPVDSAQDILAGEITADDVPDFTGEGYTFAGAFYHEIPVLRVGQVEFSSRNYVYYVTEGSENDLVALVLDDVDRIELRYKQNPVWITYTVNDGQTQDDGSITVSGIPYGQTAQGTVTVIPADNPHEVFPGDDYAFTVEIPRGYSATVSVNGRELSPTLGVSPTYHREGNIVVKDDKDAAYLPGYTYMVEKVQGVQNVQVTLKPDQNHSFNADLIKQTIYFGNGNRAESEVNNTKNSWTGTVNAGGSLTWTLTTTTTGAKWEMDGLQMNGTDLRIPFANGKTETTVLPSGTTVSVSRKYATTSTIFGSWDDTDRYVYTITLSDCYENIVVTGGNLRGRNHNEFIPYVFTGVESFQYKSGNNWVNGNISQPITAGDVSGAFRFKLLPGYGTPTLILKRSDGEQTVQQSHTPSLGPDGYYTVNFSANGLNYPALIVIEAKQITFRVEYGSGGVSGANMPVDANEYSLAGKKEVLIPLAVPADPTGKKIFTGWKNGDQIYAPNALATLEALQANDGMITFTAQWNDAENAEQITYSIRFVDPNVTENGGILYEMSSQAPSNTALILDVNSPTIVDWLKQHPEYEVDTENTTFYYESIQNGGVVELIVKEKQATITYVAVGPDGETDFGSVTPKTEVIQVKTGTVKGSDAAAGTNFRFMGWFNNAECTGNPISENLHYTPEKSGTLWEDVTYYAKFDYALADLTISKTGWETIDENQSFVFHVRGTEATNTAGIDMTVIVHGQTPVTIKDLPVGSYTVSEESGWSWRYNGGEDQNVILTEGPKKTASFANTRNKNLKWLNGCAWCDNFWIDGSAIKANEGRRP